MGESKFLSDENGKFEIKEIDGKTAFVFDSTPALLFVSGDGTTSSDSFFVQGTEITSMKSLEILCDPGEGLTTYKLERYACLREEKVSLDEVKPSQVINHYNMTIREDADISKIVKGIEKHMRNEMARP